MAQPLIDRVLTDARSIIADRRRRLRCTGAVTAQARSAMPAIALVLRRL